MGDPQALLLDALAYEARGHRALLDGDAATGAEAMRAAADLYRASWESAPPTAFGRLVGMLKAAVIAGDARAEAAYARAELAAPPATSPPYARAALPAPPATSSPAAPPSSPAATATAISSASPTAGYALGIAALVAGDDAAASAAAEAMRAGGPAFARAADAIAALAAGDAPAYAEAVRAIVADFEARDEHLTGVPIADTALMLERLAAPRGLRARPATALLPA